MSWTNAVTKEPNLSLSTNPLHLQDVICLVQAFLKAAAEDFELRLSFGLINGDTESEVESEWRRTVETQGNRSLQTPISATENFSRVSD